MASYSGNWNGAPTSTNRSREGGASPYMRGGVFTGKFEGSFPSLAVKYGKYDGVGANFRSASPFMQGGMFKGAFEGPRREFNMAQRGMGAPMQRGAGGEGMGGGGGGIAPAAGPIGPMRQPPAAPPAQAPAYGLRYAALRSAYPPGTMQFGPFSPKAQPYDMRYASLRSAYPPGTMGFGPFGTSQASLKYQDRIAPTPNWNPSVYTGSGLSGGPMNNGGGVGNGFGGGNGWGW